MTGAAALRGAPQQTQTLDVVKHPHNIIVNSPLARSKDFKINRPPSAVVGQPERKHTHSRGRVSEWQITEPTLERSGRAAHYCQVLDGKRVLQTVVGGRGDIAGI